VRNSKIYECQLIDIQTEIENNVTTYYPLSKDYKFSSVKRVYFLYNSSLEKIRGEHAHKDLNQIIIAGKGSFEITINDGENFKTYLLDNPNKGLRIIPGIWRSLKNFSEDSVCIVFASELYEPDDYIHNFDEFLIYKQVTSI